MYRPAFFFREMALVPVVVWSKCGEKYVCNHQEPLQGRTLNLKEVPKSLRLFRLSPDRVRHCDLLEVVRFGPNVAKMQRLGESEDPDGW